VASLANRFRHTCFAQAHFNQYQQHAAVAVIQA